MSNVAVDMTPVLPGGGNGGAKALALELLKGFREVAAHDHFLILTASWNHDELSILDGPNMKRLCILHSEKPGPRISNYSMLWRVYRKCQGMHRVLRELAKRNPLKKGPLSASGVDLLFCPFTSTANAEPHIPVVSVFLDLQHKDLPHFFSPREIAERDLFMNAAVRRAERIVCISESARQSLIKHFRPDARKIHTVPIWIHSRLERIGCGGMDQTLARLGLTNEGYLFYPANFWPHKNHRMLLAAYGMLLSRNPHKKNLELVFTGALDGAQDELVHDVRLMGLEDRVHFLGFLEEEELATVWRGAGALVFPSLYEGFGIPVLEAMAFGKPILCSDTTSLPEVGGDAALYFDPRKPHEIVRCLEKLLYNTKLAKSLVERGRKRVENFTTREMVRRYLKIFGLAMGKTV